MRPTGLSCVFAAVACTLAPGCGPPSTDRAAGPDDQPIPAVEVVEARQGAVPLRERLTGTVRAAGEVAILPQVSGPIIEVLAQNGDHVKKGQPLVRIQAAGADAQVRQAQSAVAAAEAELQQAQAQAGEIEAEYERNKALGDRGLVPLNTVESLRAQAAAARAAVTSAAAQLKVAQAATAEQRELQSQTIVRAPITGQVGQRNAEVGMRADTQTPLFIMGRLEDMRVEVPVAQEVVARLRPGQRVELRVGNATAVDAAVSRISPFLESGSFSAEVEIDVPNTASPLISGMFVTVDIYYGESEQATLVPASAIYEDPRSGERGVFVTGAPPPATGAAAGGDGTLAPPVPLPFRAVEVVAEAAQTVGVEGVRAGEWVVVIGQHLLAAQDDEQAPRGRPRVIAWERIMELQELQREDLLKEFLERQRREGAQ
jgi:RND family efflux transporter MFP subunit